MLLKTVFIVFENAIFIEIFSSDKKAKDYIKKQKESGSNSHYHFEKKEVL